MFHFACWHHGGAAGLVGEAVIEGGYPTIHGIFDHWLRRYIALLVESLAQSYEEIVQ